MKKAIKKIAILMIIVMLLMQTMPYTMPISYAADLVEDQQRAVSMYTQKFVKEGNERNLLLYSQDRKDRIKGYNLELTSNEYGQFDSIQNNGAPFTNMLVYDSASFVATMYHRALGMELSANENARDNIYTVESFMKDARYGGNNFRFVGGTKYNQEQLIQMADSGQLLPGDLIVYDDETHIMMYLGTGDEIIYEELIIEEAVVEDQTQDGPRVDDFNDSSIAEGTKLTIQLGENAHYLAHAYDANRNIEISALELLEYREDYNGKEDHDDGKYYVIRPIMSEANGITTKHKVIMDIVWPDSSYSAYTKLGTDPVTGKKQEYYYVGIPTTEEYFARDKATDTQYVYEGTTDSGEAIYKQTENYDWLVEEAGDILSWFSGYVGLLFRSWAVGWTDIIEGVVSDTIQSVGSVQREISQSVEGNEYAITKDDTLNIEDIVYNRVPLFDANIFNTSTIAGVPIRDRMPDEEFEELKARAELKGMEGVEAREELEEYYNSVLNTMSELELKELEEKAFAGDENAMERLEEYRNQTNPILVIRKNVASMYLAIRNIAIVGLLLTLIYIGIRMAITTIAEQKAKYKSILVNWCVSLIIVFMIHYIMIFILQLNDALVKMLPNLTGGVSFYETFREMAYEMNFMNGWIGTIMYMVLLVFMIKYVWIYIKRFFTLCVLTIAAPIIGIGYSIDKIKDNKSQSLSRWVRNYVFNVIIQFVHAALYTVLMSIVYTLLAAGHTFPAAIFAVVFLNFITQAPKIVQNIFGIDSAHTLKNTLEDIGTQMAGAATIFGLVKTQTKLYGAAIRAPGKINEKVFGESLTDAIRYKHNDPVSAADYSYLGDEDAIREKVKEEEAIREKLEKQRKQKIKEDKARRRANSEAQMQYAKNIMSMGKGLAYAAAAIPTTVISPQAGITMLLNSRNTYSKARKNIQEKQSSILGYDVDKFKGRFSMNKVIIGAAGGNRIVGTVATAKEQWRAENKQLNEASLHRNIMNAQTENTNEVRGLLKQLDEQKYVLQQNGQYTGEAKAKIDMEILTMSTILKSYADGENPEIDIKDGKMTVVIPQGLAKVAIEDYMTKNGIDSISQEDMPKLLEHISEYANVNIVAQSKLNDVNLVIKSEIVKKVVRQKGFSSYRPDEDPSRHRDPREASSLLEQNNITEKSVEDYVKKKVDFAKIDKIDREDISKMAEELFEDVKDQDSLTDDQKKDIMLALEGVLADKIEQATKDKLADITENEYIREKKRRIEIELSNRQQKKIEDAINGALEDNTKEAAKVLDKELGKVISTPKLQKEMERLNAKQLVALIYGKTQIEIPEKFQELARRNDKLRKMQKELRLSEGKTTYTDNDTKGIIDMINRRK